MLRIRSKQMSFHTSLYNKIPKNHILKVIDEHIDFTFINELVKDFYSTSNGRDAKQPILMCKLLFLKHLYGMSDKAIIEDACLNLAHMYFLHLNPEDTLPHHSLLSKFRCHRIEESTLDQIIIEIIRQCVEQGIINGDSVSIDSTHIEANTFLNTAERLLKKMGKKIIKTYQKSDETFQSKYDAPDYESIEDKDEGKKVMTEYVENVITEVTQSASNNLDEATQEIINKSKAIIEDPKFLKQKGVKSLVDTDARIGHKSKTNRFFGYKTEYIMTTEENIITAICTENGAYVDGSNTKELIERTLESTVDFKEFYGDKAYFRKSIMDEVELNGAKAYIPIHHGVYRMDETRFSYNKDSDEWTCHLGNISEERKYYESRDKGYKRNGYRYYFNKEQCECCPEREICAGKRNKRKILNLGINTSKFYELSKEQKEEEWLEKYQKRASIESKNAEMKRFHGLYRASGYGLKSVSIQAKLTAIAVNFKTIARLIIGKTRKKVVKVC